MKIIEQIVEYIIKVNDNYVGIFKVDILNFILLACNENNRISAMNKSKSRYLFRFKEKNKICSYSSHISQ